jgi:tRNA(Ile)-lysidine synthetase-like protein
MRDCVSGSSAPARNVPGGLILSREADPSTKETRLIFRHPDEERAHAPFLAILPVPGVAFVPGLCLEWIAEDIPPEDARPFPPREGWEAVADADTLTPPFLLRTWEPGDRIRTSGGAKKLQDLFSDAKICRAERHRWPVLCDGPDRRVVWVPGLALHEDVWVTPNTRRGCRWKLDRVTNVE